MKYVIRRAEEGDLPGMLTIINREIAENVAHFGTELMPLEELLSDFQAQSGRYPWLVAADGDSLLGYAKAGPWKTRGAYRWTTEIGVYVSPDYHGRGVATALYAELFPLLRDRGFHCVVAGIALPNEPSVRLHERFGMQKIGVFPAQGFKHGRWIDVGYWSLNLSLSAPCETNP